MRRTRLFLAAAAAVAVWSAAVRAQAAEEGKALFDRRCAGCHALDSDKEGPRLRRVYGRAAGAVESFQYSDALKKSGIKWDSATLDQWLTDTEKLVPASDMNVRVPNAEERRAIIVYLERSR
jgi:cytochrome c